MGNLECVFFDGPKELIFHKDYMPLSLQCNQSAVFIMNASVDLVTHVTCLPHGYITERAVLGQSWTSLEDHPTCNNLCGLLVSTCAQIVNLAKTGNLRS